MRVTCRTCLELRTRPSMESCWPSGDGKIRPPACSRHLSCRPRRPLRAVTRSSAPHRCRWPAPDGRLLFAGRGSPSLASAILQRVSPSSPACSPRNWQRLASAPRSRLTGTPACKRLTARCTSALCSGAPEMTARPVFGDFVQAAAAQLDATERRPGGLTRAADIEDTSRNLLRLVTAMSRCMATTISAAGDRTWREATAKPDPWTRARAETRDALDNTARFLRQRRLPNRGADTEPVTADGPTLPVARRLAAAASSLQAGQDLLQTHYVVN